MEHLLAYAPQPPPPSTIDLAYDHLQWSAPSAALPSPATGIAMQPMLHHHSSMADHIATTNGLSNSTEILGTNGSVDCQEFELMSEFYHQPAASMPVQQQQNQQHLQQHQQQQSYYHHSHPNAFQPGSYPQQASYAHESNITYAYEIRPYWAETAVAGAEYTLIGGGGGGGAVDGCNGFGYSDNDQYDQDQHLGKGIIDTAKQLQVKGLCDLSSDYYAENMATAPPAPTAAASTAASAVKPTTPQTRTTFSAPHSTAALPSMQTAAAPQQQQQQHHQSTTTPVRRSRAKRQRHNGHSPPKSGAKPSLINSVVYAHLHGGESNEASNEASNSGGGQWQPAHFAAASSGSATVTAHSSLDAEGDQDTNQDQSMMNAVSMGGYLDFAVAEPAAPAATPVVSESGDVFLDIGSKHTHGSGGDDSATMDTGGEAGAVISRSSAIDSLQLLQSTQSNLVTTAEPTTTTTGGHVHRHSGATVTTTMAMAPSTSVSSPQHLQQQHQQHVDIIHHHVDDLLDDQTAQMVTIDPEAGDAEGATYIMELNVSGIKHEQADSLNESGAGQDQEQLQQQQQQQQQQQHQQLGATAELVNSSGRMVTVMTQNGDVVEMYQSDTSDDSHITQLSGGGDVTATAAAAAAGDVTIITMDPDDDDEEDDDGDDEDTQDGAGGGTALKQTAAAAAASSAAGILVAAHPKTWSQANMDAALAALRAQTMSLTKASTQYGIPSTTLWQRAHRLGIDTPKKEGPSKTWSDDSLNHALEALRNGEISANKASKAFGIPSSTLYKIARREGIRLAAPFNAAPTNWSVDDLDRALESIRSGATSVQKASLEFGIPTGTLYGRCKREGIELSRSNPTPWSEENMMEALESVRLGVMSINQAAIHYNLPYSSLYGRFKRGKPDTTGSPDGGGGQQLDQSSDNSFEFSPRGNSGFAEQSQASQAAPSPRAYQTQ